MAKTGAADVPKISFNQPSAPEPTADQWRRSKDRRELVKVIVAKGAYVIYGYWSGALRGDRNTLPMREFVAMYPHVVDPPAWEKP